MFDRRKFLQASLALPVAGALEPLRSLADLQPAERAAANGRFRFVDRSESRLPTPRCAVGGANVVIEQVDFSGCYVSIESKGATFRSCRFTGSAGIAIIIDIYGNAADVSFDSCHFDGRKLDAPVDAMLRARNARLDVSNCLFENISNDAIKMVGGRIRGSAFRGGGYFSRAHSDAITIPASFFPTLIENNHIDWRSPADARMTTTSALAIGPEHGDVHDVIVRNNVLLGGAYTVYATTHPKIVEKFRNANVSIVDNVIDGGQFGGLYPHRHPSNFVVSGNRTQSGAPVRL